MSQSYPAEMFRPGTGARAVSGHLEVQPNRLVFSSDEEDGSPPEFLELPTLGLGCRLSGYDNRTFFFSHTLAGGAEVAVKDAGVAQDEILGQLAVFQEARRVGRATHRRFWGCVALLTLGAVFLLLSVGTLAALFLRWMLAG